MAMTMEDLANQQAFPGARGTGMTYGSWLVGQVLPKVVEELAARRVQGAGPAADAKEIASRTMLIVNEILTRMTSSEEA